MTKRSRELNPVEAARKAAKQREQKRHKAAKKERSNAGLSSDPAELRREIARIRSLESSGQATSQQIDQRRKLETTLENAERTPASRASQSMQVLGLDRILGRGSSVDNPVSVDDDEDDDDEESDEESEDEKSPNQPQNQGSKQLKSVKREHSAVPDTLSALSEPILIELEPEEENLIDEPSFLERPFYLPPPGQFPRIDRFVYCWKGQKPPESALKRQPQQNVKSEFPLASAPALAPSKPSAADYLSESLPTAAPQLKPHPLTLPPEQREFQYIPRRHHVRESEEGREADPMAIEEEGNTKKNNSANPAFSIRILSQEESQQVEQQRQKEAERSKSTAIASQPAAPRLARSTVKPSFVPSSLLVKNRPEPEKDDIRLSNPVNLALGSRSALDTAPPVQSDSESEAQSDQE